MKSKNNMHEFKYFWLHLLTGKKGVSSHQHFTNRREFLEAMSNWNNDQRWKYWEGTFRGTNIG